jgi:hypothetical protein
MKPRRPTIKDSTHHIHGEGAKRKARQVAARAARKAAAKKAKMEAAATAPKEDANQAAARIVKEATEGN